MTEGYEKVLASGLAVLFFLTSLALFFTSVVIAITAESRFDLAKAMFTLVLSGMAVLASLIFASIAEE